MMDMLLERSAVSVAVHGVCRMFFDVCVFVCVPAGGETSGSGQAGDTQHSQEADCLPAGSAGHWCGEEICQVTFCEYLYLSDTDT